MSIHVGSPVYIQGREVGKVTGRDRDGYLLWIEDASDRDAANADPSIISFTPPTERSAE